MAPHVPVLGPPVKQNQRLAAAGLRKVELDACGGNKAMPNADNFALHLFAALAEQEREFIAQRTKDALAALQRRAVAGETEAVAKVERRTQALEKGRGVATGREGAATQAAVAKAAAFNTIVKPHLESCLYNKLTTLQSVADCLNTKGVTTSRGSEWNATAVRRLMLALNLSFDKAA